MRIISTFYCFPKREREREKKGQFCLWTTTCSTFFNSSSSNAPNQAVSTRVRLDLVLVIKQTLVLVVSLRRISPHLFLSLRQHCLPHIHTNVIQRGGNKQASKTPFQTFNQVAPGQARLGKAILSIYYREHSSSIHFYFAPQMSINGGGDYSRATALHQLRCSLSSLLHSHFHCRI